MTYRIRGLDPAQFALLIAVPEAELAARNARCEVAGPQGYYPCRVSLEDTAPGETLLRTLLDDPAIAYIDAHNAMHGGFAARIERHEAEECFT